MTHGRTASWVLALGLAAAASPRLEAQVSVGDKAPAFEIADPRDTEIKDFAALRGKVLLLDFFATW